ncbi:MAG: AAA domain-containing protein [Cytophagaceae bacterium]|nr:AAA domain-containing protein [Cytophagaceae bacterium]MDW8457053.1 AAA domain-containing protein [Cytophagaceae bacterium]
MSAEQYIKQLLDLLEKEKQADKLLHEQKLAQSSLQERKKSGITWHPVIISDYYYGVADRLIVEIERNTNTDMPNLFQVGATVKFFSTKCNYEYRPLEGVVNWVTDHKMRVTFSIDDLPEWMYDGGLGVDMLFDDKSYHEMEAALHNLLHTKDKRTLYLRDVLLGITPPTYNHHKSEALVQIPYLNDIQNTAVNKILQARDVALIHGPPGTGKTTTLIASILYTLQHEDQVLVCAPSNAAVDLLTVLLKEKGVRVLRVGNPARIQDDLLSLSLDGAMCLHKEYKTIKEYRKRASEFKNMAMKYKRHYGPEERAQRKAILAEARKIMKEAEDIEKYICQDLVSKAQVITSTLVGCTHQSIADKKFSSVFIDEAAQALEPACWIPILKAHKVIMAGDHCQLPPTIKSQEAAKKGLSKTLFEKIISISDASTMLQVQYRMNEKIMNYPNKVFYNNNLSAHASVKEDAIPDFPVLQFIDTAGTGYNEEYEPDSAGIYNTGEAQILLSRLEQFAHANASHKRINVGVISPYKAQVELLKSMLQNNGKIFSSVFEISVNTIDSFQGQERDVIFISLVRSNSTSEIGFLSDLRRMNVAMTRARKSLIMIGDSGTLGRHEFYKGILDYIEKEGLYSSAWEWIC